MFRRQRTQPFEELPGAFEQDRRLAPGNVLGIGTLACASCDAPIGIGSEPLSPAAPLTCPFCAHHAPLRDFLSLEPPTRPTRVVVRVRVVG